MKNQTNTQNINVFYLLALGSSRDNSSMSFQPLLNLMNPPLQLKGWVKRKKKQVDERMLDLNDGCSKLWRPSRSLAQGQPWFVWFGTGIAGVWLITAYLNIRDTEVIKIVEVPPQKRARSSKTAVIKSSLQCSEEIKAPGFKINTEMNFSVVTSKIILS